MPAMRQPCDPKYYSVAMKVQVLEVLWHTANDKGKSDPVMSIDFTFDRLLASGGADKEVKIWRIKEDDAGSVSVDFIASLEGHMKGVNAVRFSPDGMALASAGGDEAVIIWTLHPHISSWADVKSRKDVSRTVLRKMGEVYDLAWSPDSASLMCGSVDNSCYVWDVVPKRRATLLGASEPPRPELSNTITQHSHFVTGVAWDPAGAHLATLGNDRTLRVHTRKVPGWMHEVLGAARERKVAANPPDGSGLPQQVPGAPPGLQQQNFMGLSLRPTRKKDKALELAATCRTVEWEAGDAAEGSAAKGTLFLDEQVPSFFRRPCWTADGALLVAPAGMAPSSSRSEPEYVTHVYLRGQWGAPALQLGGLPSPSIISRACPVLFANEQGLTHSKAGAAGGEKTSGSGGGGSALEGAYPVEDISPLRFPHRCVWAVGTLESVFVYDSEHAAPVAAAANHHFEKLTDMAWSRDGGLLLVSSIDGCVSVLNFRRSGQDGEPAGTDNELGQALPRSAQPRHMQLLPVARTAAEAAWLDKVRLAEEAVWAGAAPGPKPAASKAAPAAAAAATEASTAAAQSGAPDKQSQSLGGTKRPLPATEGPAAAQDAQPQAKGNKRRITLTTLST